MKEVINFLIKAKKATYAGKGPEIPSSRPQSHDLEYLEDDLRYIDTYLGGAKFVGEEALWRNNIPIWAMNYCGRIVATGFNGDFLKEALFSVPPALPYRGPSEYRKGNFIYKCNVNGDFQWFSGSEQIYLLDEKVYECLFHGGIIK